MDEDDKEYYEDMIDEDSSFTKTDYRDAVSVLMARVDALETEIPEETLDNLLTRALVSVRPVLIDYIHRAYMHGRRDEKAEETE